MTCVRSVLSPVSIRNTIWSEWPNRKRLLIQWAFLQPCIMITTGNIGVSIMVITPVTIMHHHPLHQPLTFFSKCRPKLLNGCPIVEIPTTSRLIWSNISIRSRPIPPRTCRTQKSIWKASDNTFNKRCHLLASIVITTSTTKQRQQRHRQLQQLNKHRSKRQPLSPQLPSLRRPRHLWSTVRPHDRSSPTHHWHQWKRTTSATT